MTEALDHMALSIIAERLEQQRKEEQLRDRQLLDMVRSVEERWYKLHLQDAFPFDWRALRITQRGETAAVYCELTGMISGSVTLSMDRNGEIDFFYQYSNDGYTRYWRARINHDLWNIWSDISGYGLKELTRSIMSCLPDEVNANIRKLASGE